MDPTLDRRLKLLMLMRLVMVTTLLLVAVYVEAVSENLLPINPLYFLIVCTYALTVIHAVAGFTGRSRVKTTSLVDAGGKLPIILTFIDTDEHVQRVMPKLREMAAHRLIVRENVVIEQGSLE